MQLLKERDDLLQARFQASAYPHRDLESSPPARFSAGSAPAESATMSVERVMTSSPYRTQVDFEKEVKAIGPGGLRIATSKVIITNKKFIGLEDSDAEEISGKARQHFKSSVGFYFGKR